MTKKNLVLRTVYLNAEVDDKLRDEAFASRKSKNDLIRRYLELGMQAERDRLVPKVATKSPVAKRVTDGKAKPAAANKVAAKKAPAKKAVARKQPARVAP